MKNHLPNPKGACKNQRGTNFEWKMSALNRIKIALKILEFERKIFRVGIHTRNVCDSRRINLERITTNIGSVAFTIQRTRHFL